LAFILPSGFDRFVSPPIDLKWFDGGAMYPILPKDMQIAHDILNVLSSQ
jgi:hypothetical protein